MLGSSGCPAEPLVEDDARHPGSRMSGTVTPIQAAVCAAHGVAPVPLDSELKVGIARNVRAGLQPVNGFRHFPEPGTTGWFIYAGGEPETDPDFFVPLHVSHLDSWCPDVMPYLALPPGWRFLLAPGYEDVWFDKALLQPSPSARGLVPRSASCSR